ncbi:MAG TPA: hypothetical protein VK815_08480 [Candidatus Acidoferrales bacterium]|jgi:hypothetical protein|nr:hypothetical protein [Candidatus Acidoferrales bacterium]
MRPGLLDSLTDLIEATPVRSIIMTCQRECRRLEESLAGEHSAPFSQAIPILIFFRFVEAARKGTSVQFFAANFPARHLELYQKVVARLVAAGELPVKTMAAFQKMAGGMACPKVRLTQMQKQPIT